MSTTPKFIEEPDIDPLKFHKRMDELVCGWSVLTGHSFTEEDLNSLVELLGNELKETVFQKVKAGIRIGKDLGHLKGKQEADKELLDTLKEFQLSHEHNETEPDYHPLGDTYGWCSICQTKVGLNEDIARDVVRKYESKLPVSHDPNQDGGMPDC